MNRTLKRPMFRIGGSAGTGITSGLDKPRKKYQQGSMPNFQIGGLPGFLTGFGLNLLSTPPQGNIFQTAATAAQDPFRALQAQQAAAMKTASARAFARELAQEEREFEEKQLGRRLAVEREKIDKRGGGDLLKRIESAKENYGGNEIKAAREIDFYDNKFNELEGEYGDEGVFITPVDLSIYEKESPKLTDKELRKFVQQNSRAGRQVIYDVSTNRAVRLLVNKETGLYEVRPADPTQIDDVGEIMPDPDKPTAGLFGQKTKPDVVTPKIKELGEEFSEEMYQTP